jgi:hypothetical protein
MSKKHLSSYLQASPRTLLFYFTVVILLLSTVIFSLGFILNNSAILITGSIILLVWFIAIFISVLPQTDTFLSTRLNQLKRGALIIFVFLFVAGLLGAATIVILVPHVIQDKNISSDLHQLLTGVQRDYGYNDGTTLSQQAVENLLKGQNPYAHANIIQALLKYHGTYDRVTPLRTGIFSDVFPYPAASFLLPAPFIFIGISDIRIVYAIFFLAGLAYAVKIIPKKKRLLFIGVVLISLELWNTIFAGGELSSLCFPFLLVAWLALNRNLWLSAICMGLAVATKQTAWFLLPFYLILLFKTQGVKKLLTVLAIIAGIFIITNLPFVIADPKLWFSSIISPMMDPMFPTGGGLITLVTSGLFKIQSSLPFTILEGIVFIAAIIWYFLYCRRYPQTGPILAIIPLFFAWRSMFPYFFYVDIIVLAYIMVNDDAGRQTILLVDNPTDHEASIPISTAG